LVSVADSMGSSCHAKQMTGQQMTVEYGIDQSVSRGGRHESYPYFVYLLCRFVSAPPHCVAEGHDLRGHRDADRPSLNNRR
jgi:hypothetical protein